MNESETLEFFNSLRNKKYSEQFIYSKLNEFCDSSNVNILEEIRGSLTKYLAKEEPKFKKKFTKSNIDVEISRREGLDLVIPYRRVVTKNGIETYINVEGLLYPLEFSALKFLEQFIANRQSKLLMMRTTENPYPDIFSCLNSYLLFENWVLSMRFVTTGYSFIYRAMYSDGLIKKKIRDIDFRNWLNEEFEIIIGKTKPLKEYKSSVLKLLYEEKKAKYHPYKP